MSTLEKAITIATQAHEGQVDKCGFPYILHPLRVMLAFRVSTMAIAAVLHDVVEDTAVTLEDLRNEGFDEKIISAVDAITKRDSVRTIKIKEVWQSLDYCDGLENR